MPVELTTPGLRLVEHEFAVPLDHSEPGGERITVFAREVADPDGLDRPLLVYLQGGPGHEAARPTRNPSAPAWLDRALRDFRVLMLDQRGTGRSTPVGALPGRTPHEQADYLAHFRADAIVRDAEWIRGELGVERWSVLGQSFGGFCVVCYLSLAPEGLREAFITGGLPPLGNRIDDVYRATYARALDVSRRYYERYPGDRERVLALQEREDLLLAVGRPPDGAPAAPARRPARHERELREAALPARAARGLARVRTRRRRRAVASRATRCTRCCTRRAGPTGARPAGRRSA